MPHRSAMVPAFVGIDVAKDRLEVHLLPSGEAFAVARDHAGLERPVAHLARRRLSWWYIRRNRHEALASLH